MSGHQSSPADSVALVATLCTILSLVVSPAVAPPAPQPSKPCNDDLGLESGLLSSQYIRASSSYRYISQDSTYAYLPGNARLKANIGTGGWSPATKSTSEYWQADLAQVVNITSLSIQGFKPRFEKGDRFVQTFQIYASMDTVNFAMVTPPGKAKSFAGTTDDRKVRTYSFSPPLTALVIRLTNFTTKRGTLAGIRVGVRGCNLPEVFSELQQCADALGMQSGVILDSQITAKTKYSRNYRPSYGRLNRKLGNGGWCGQAETMGQVAHHFEVDLLRDYNVSAIATQGISDKVVKKPFYILDYMIEYESEAEGIYHFSDIDAGTEHIFSGNSDSNSVNKHYFFEPIRARYIRLYNFSVPTSDLPCMRLEIYGCNVSAIVTSAPTVRPTTRGITMPRRHAATSPPSAVSSRGDQIVARTGASSTLMSVVATEERNVAETTALGPASTSGANVTAPTHGGNGVGTAHGEFFTSAHGSHGTAIGAGVGCGALLFLLAAVLCYHQRKTLHQASVNIGSTSISSDTPLSTERGHGRVAESVLYTAHQETHEYPRPRSADSMIYDQPNAIQAPDAPQANENVQLANGTANGCTTSPRSSTQSVSTTAPQRSETIHVKNPRTSPVSPPKRTVDAIVEALPNVPPPYDRTVEAHSPAAIGDRRTNNASSSPRASTSTANGARELGPILGQTLEYAISDGMELPRTKDEDRAGRSAHSYRKDDQSGLRRAEDLSGANQGANDGTNRHAKPSTASVQDINESSADRTAGFTVHPQQDIHASAEAVSVQEAAGDTYDEVAFDSEYTKTVRSAFGNGDDAEGMRDSVQYDNVELSLRSERADPTFQTTARSNNGNTS